jgi:hypothetical protein
MTVDFGNWLSPEVKALIFQPAGSVLWSSAWRVLLGPRFSQNKGVSGTQQNPSASASPSAHFSTVEEPER